MKAPSQGARTDYRLGRGGSRERSRGCKFSPSIHHLTHMYNMFTYRHAQETVLKQKQYKCHSRENTIPNNIVNSVQRLAFNGSFLGMFYTPKFAKIANYSAINLGEIKITVHYRKINCIACSNKISTFWDNSLINYSFPLISNTKV